MLSLTTVYERFSRTNKATSENLLCRVMLCLSLIVLSACAEQELTVRLTERQSISLLVSLANQGIEGRRQYDELSGSYDILVPESSYKEAMSILNSSWPRPEFEERIADLLKDESFLPGLSQNRQGKDEQLLSLQIERLLSAVPGVEEVRALVRLPVAGGPLKIRKVVTVDRMRVAVVVKSVVDADKEESLRQHLQQLLQGFFAVEDGKDSNAVVQIFMADSSSAIGLGERVLSVGSVWPFSFRVIESDKSFMSWQITVFGLGLVIPAFVVGFVLGQRDYSKRLSANPVGRDENMR